MTLLTDLVKVSYAGDGVTTAFPVTFVFWGMDDLEVVLTTSGVDAAWVRGTNYTVTGGKGSTGTITSIGLGNIPALNTTLTIKSLLPDTQPTEIPLGGDLPSGPVEQQLDQIVRQGQQRNESLGRALKVPISDSESISTDIPGSTVRADKFLAFDTDGTAIAAAGTSANLGPVSAFVDTLLPAVDAAAFRALIAAVNVGDDSAFTGDNTFAGTSSFSGISTFSQIQKLGQGADVASATTLTLGDDGNSFDITGTSAITAIATKGVGTKVELRFAGILTLTHSATDLILPSGANITTAVGDIAGFEEYASGDWRCLYYTRASGKALVQPVSSLATEIATTSGTEHDFTGISSEAKRITIMFDVVSLSGTDGILIQLGVSGGIENSGYTADSAIETGSGGGQSISSTSGFPVFVNSAGRALIGTMTLNLMDSSANKWISTHAGYHSTAVYGAGKKALAATLDRVKVRTTGSDTFDAGAVTILVE